MNATCFSGSSLRDKRDWRIADFRQDLKRTLDDPERMAGFAHDRIVPFKGAIKEFAGLHAFSDQDNAAPALPDLPCYEVQPPVTNPLRGVGRNEPCPCG